MYHNCSEWKVFNSFWDEMKWSQVQLQIDSIQKQIYYFANSNQIGRVRKLQYSLGNSKKARLLAIYRVLKQSRFLKFSGIDILKNLTLPRRLELGLNIGKRFFSGFNRRIYRFDPYYNRPYLLFASNFSDRCQQELFRIIIQPEWECKFESTSYAFRVGLGCYNALHFIKNFAHTNRRYIFFCNFARGFTNLRYKLLLYKINFVGVYKLQIIKWIKSLILDNLHPSSSFSYYFQGRSILLAILNILLHGLHSHLSINRIKSDFYRESSSMVWYTNVLLIIDYCLKNTIRSRMVLRKFFLNSGIRISDLELSFINPIKFPSEVKFYTKNLALKGFDFLGFQIKQFCLPNSCSFNELVSISHLKTFVYPSFASISKHQHQLHNLVLKQGKTLSQKIIIEKLNITIKPWVNYFGNFDSNLLGYIVKQDYLLYLKLRRWVKRQKGSFKKGLSYWQHLGTRKWVFMTKNRSVMLNYHLHYI